MTIMLRKEQRAASGEGKTARKFQSNYHMITVGGKWAVTAGPDKSGRPLQQDNRSFSFRLSHFPNDRAKRKRTTSLTGYPYAASSSPSAPPAFRPVSSARTPFLGCLFPLPVIDIGIHSLLHYAAEHLLALRFQQMVGKMNIITHFQIHPLFREA